MVTIPEESCQGIELLHRLQENSILNNSASCLPNFVSGSYCIVAFGIEHFRLFNKWYGRKEGDALLVYVAEALHVLEAEEEIVNDIEAEAEPIKEDAEIKEEVKAEEPVAEEENETDPRWAALKNIKLD